MFAIHSNFLTPKQLEYHEWLFSTVATDDLVLNHEAISSHSTDEMYIVQFL